MRTVKVEYKIDIPDINATDEETEAYLEYILGINGSLHNSNPYSDEIGAQEPQGFLEWEDV